jgi:hypothetical protein
MSFPYSSIKELIKDTGKVLEEIVYEKRDSPEVKKILEEIRQTK